MSDHLGTLCTKGLTHFLSIFPFISLFSSILKHFLRKNLSRSSIGNQHTMLLTLEPSTREFFLVQMKYLSAYALLVEFNICEIRRTPLFLIYLLLYLVCSDKVTEDIYIYIYIYLLFVYLINPFQANVLFLYPLTT